MVSSFVLAAEGCMGVFSRSLAVLGVLAACQPCPSAEFRQDFRSAPPDPEFLTVVGREHGCRVEPVPDGLRVTIPPGGAQGGPVGVVLRPWVRGDFEVTASYELEQVGPPRDGFGAGVGLVVETDSPTDESLTIERQVLLPDGDRFIATHITSDEWGERQYRPERAPAGSATGRLRLSRSGSVVEASYDDGGGTFRTLRRVALGGEDVALLRLACFTGQSKCAVDVVLKGLDVRADELPAAGLRRGKAATRLGAWKRLAAVGLVNLMLAASLAAWRWPGIVSRLRAWTWGRHRRRDAAVVALGGVLVFGVSLAAHLRAVRTNSVHEDERVWVGRAYFYRLAVLRHDFDHPLWGDFDGIDAPHVGEFLAGLGLQAAGLPLPEVPERAAPWTDAPLPSGALLRAARMPSTLLGAAIAPMVYLIAVLATGRLIAGLAAGLLYAVHPLALLCEARAMSDGGFQFFCVLAMLALAWACRRDAGGIRESLGRGRGLVLIVVGPLALGLAIGAKLTGVVTAAAAVGTLVLVVAWGLRGASQGRRRWALDGLAFVASFSLLTASWTVLCNPTFYPDPLGRFRAMADHRWKTGQRQAAKDPQWALHTPAEKVRAAYANVARDGLGTWSLPLAVLSAFGLVSMAAGEVRRWRQVRPPSPALAVLVWAAVLGGGMLPTLPLNWDRYYLPFVPVWALAAGAGLGAVASLARRYLGTRAAAPSPCGAASDPSG